MDIFGLQGKSGAKFQGESGNPEFIHKPKKSRERKQNDGLSVVIFSPIFSVSSRSTDAWALRSHFLSNNSVVTSSADETVQFWNVSQVSDLFCVLLMHELPETERLHTVT